MGSGNCNKVFFLAFLAQIHFRDFNLFGQILFALKQIFDLLYSKTYGHWLSLKMMQITFDVWQNRDEEMATVSTNQE